MPKQLEPKVARYLVESPVENFVGVGAGGVQFAYGRAEVNEGWVLDWYREKGFKVTKIEDKEAPVKALEDMNVDELKEEATSRGLKVNSKSTKVELLTMLIGEDNV